MPTPPTLNSLIVGGDSRLGSALSKHLKEQNVPVTATTRRNKHTGVFLDLEQPSFQQSRTLRNFEIVYFLAGITSQADCEANPEWSRRINVTQTKDYLQHFVDLGIPIVFTSSDLVETSNSLYARQKLEIEEYLANTNSVSIRFGKVLDKDSGILPSWLQSLSRGKPIEARDDLAFAPISLADAVDVFFLLHRPKLAGIVRAVSRPKVSYYEAIRFLAKEMNLDTSLINPITVEHKTEVEPNADKEVSEYIFDPWETLRTTYRDQQPSLRTV